MFEESGDEDFLIAQELLVRPHAPRLARLVSKLYHHPPAEDRRQSHESHDKYSEGEEEDYSEHRFFSYRSSESLYSAAVSVGGVQENDSNNSGYSLQALYYLTINYILGVGVLGQPAAFARAGFLLCGGILSTVTLFSYMTVMWVAETGERYHRQCQQESAKKQQQQQSTMSEATPLLTTRPSGESHERPDERQHWDRYEVVDLVGHYLGPGHQILYQASLMALMYIGLLAYSQVFCSAVTELFWDPTRIEGLPQLVFGLMVVPLSCVELDEQISVQSIMAAVRFLAIFIMVFGSVLALLLDDSNTNHHQEEGPPFWAPPQREGCQMSYTACVSGFGVAFSTSLFSQLFQHSVPGLLRPLRDQPSKHTQVPKTLGASLLTTLCLYLLLGTAAASFFGASTRSSVNLNFANFTMGLDDSAPFWLLAAVKVASSIVVIFPALDTISVFPLIANTLGNNLCSAAVGPSTIKWCARSLHKVKGLCHSAITTTSSTRGGQRPAFGDLTQEERKDLITKSSRLTTIFWRLVAALPPLFGSLVAADLSFSLLLAGVAGVYVAFFAPSMMQLKSLSTIHNNSDASRTIFHGWYSTTALCYPVLVFATFSLGAVLVQIKEAWVEMRS